MHAGEEDDLRIGFGRPGRQRQAIAGEVGHLLHFGNRIVMRQNHGALLFFQTKDLIDQLTLVFHSSFLFNFLRLINKEIKSNNNTCSFCW